MSDAYDERFKLITIGTSPNFYVQWFEGGHSRRRSTGTRSRQEAEAYRAAFRLEIERNPTGPIEVRALIDLYTNAKDGQITSMDRQLLCAKHLKTFFGATRVEDAGPSAQDRYVAQRRRQGVRDETIRRELSVLSAAFNFAVSREKIDRAPAMVLLKKSKARERWITRDEAARILRHLRTGGWTPPDDMPKPVNPDGTEGIREEPKGVRDRTATSCFSPDSPSTPALARRRSWS